MADKIIILLENHDASQSITTPSHAIPFTYEFDLIIFVDGLDSDYLFTIEVAHEDEDSKFTPYKLDQVVLKKDENQLIFDDFLPGKFMRFKYDDNGNSGGTINLTLNLKRPAKG